MSKSSARLAAMAANAAKTAKKAVTKKERKTSAKKPATKANTTVSANKNPTRKRKRRQSEVYKALKLRQANKARRDKSQNEDAPEPVKVFNDKLETTDLEWEVETIVDSKKVEGDTHYLVKWKGWESSHNTWEPEIYLRNALELISEFDVANPLKP